MKKVKEKYTFIDLFAGLSGIRIGFEQAASDLGVKTQCALTSKSNLLLSKPSKIDIQTRKLTTIYMTSMQI